jgi:hypothetical protein
MQPLMRASNRLLPAALFLLAAAAHADGATDVLARSKAASGGRAWDTATSWHGDGTIATGGLSGDYHVTVDLTTGRSVDAYRLGSVEGGDGYDGKLAWERDPGGEVAALDTPAALRRARSQAWLDARAYWFPPRGASTFGAVETRREGGKRYDVIVATPQGGEPVTLWFDADSALLARVVQRQGQDTVTTVFDDYRDVGGLRLPFHSVTDLTDAAGRTDPRRRIEVRLTQARRDVAVHDADFAMPRMIATATIDDPRGVTTIPFELVNNHIYVAGRIDDQPAQWLVDTGGVNLLTPAAAKKFGLSGEGRLAAAGVGSERVDLSIAHARELCVGAARLAQPVFYIVELGQLAEIEGVAADGLVGYEMFRRFGVRIDYARRELVLSTPEKFVPPRDATAVPFALDDRIPIIEATLDGLPIRLSVDTGSRSSLTLHAPFVRAHELIARYHAGPEAVLGWGVGGPSRARPARFGTLELGGLAIVGAAGELFTGDKGGFANPDLGGNLGGGVLRRFTVAFDYGNKTMYLAPNADFAKPDAFDRSGLWLIRDGDALKIVDVAADSAAARVGLKSDDRLVAIGGEAVGAHPLAEWRRRLRESAAGTRLAIDFDRAGARRHAELVLADRIPPRFAP